MKPTDIADFLLARIGEDEAVAREAGDGGPVVNGRRSELGRLWDRDYGPVLGAVEIDAHRVLIECAIKRRIVTDCASYDGSVTDGLSWRTLAALAETYADHPDFRKEWRG